MAENKTKPTKQTVDEFLAQVPDEKMRADSYALIKLMQTVTGEKPVMWGASIIGFDSYHYKYDSGREGDICMVGFSPRKSNISLYVKCGFPGQDELVAQLGKLKASTGCLYVKRLEDIHLEVLEQLVKQTVTFLRKKHG